MTNGGIHYGDSVEQHGNHNIGIIKNQAPADPGTAFGAMLAAVERLRPHLGPEDREAVDENLAVIGDGQGVEPGRLRRALVGIAGVATVAGTVGAPAVAAIQALLGALGMS
ncbi:hypothetical protein [Streptomyces sp. NPDC051211]|uniref:hypothetical protein n=1 Tax=Streptomyces sp. NPDC051211 TaxID=3154643 RepID=UPI00344E8702